MGRTEFLSETDCERALVGRAKAKASTRAKWRSSSSACRRVLEKCLTPPTLLEMGMLQQLPPDTVYRSGLLVMLECGESLEARHYGHHSPIQRDARPKGRNRPHLPGRIGPVSSRLAE